MKHRAAADPCGSPLFLKKQKDKRTKMKKILITGGTRGIGRALVTLFLSKGYEVTFVYRNSVKEAEKLERLGAQGIRCDLSNEAQLAELCDKIRSGAVNADILINNAGISSIGLLQDITAGQWARLRAVDLDAPLLLSSAVTPYMVKEKWGRIINISSMWGQVGASCEAAYSAAKAGLTGLSKALAKELGPSGITVNCVCPGVIDTDMNAELGERALRKLAEETPVERIGTPAEVAKLCLFLCSEDASFITGQVIGINGGFVIT